MDYLLVTAGRNITNRIANKTRAQENFNEPSQTNRLSFFGDIAELTFGTRSKNPPGTWPGSSKFSMSPLKYLYTTLHFYQCIILGAIDYYLTPKNQFFKILLTSALKAHFGEKWGYGTCRVKIEPLNAGKVHRKPGNHTKWTPGRMKRRFHARQNKPTFA